MSLTSLMTSLERQDEEIESVVKYWHYKMVDVHKTMMFMSTHVSTPRLRLLLGTIVDDFDEDFTLEFVPLTNKHFVFVKMYDINCIHHITIK